MPSGARIQMNPEAEWAMAQSLPLGRTADSTFSSALPCCVLFIFIYFFGNSKDLLVTLEGWVKNQPGKTNGRNTADLTTFFAFKLRMQFVTSCEKTKQAKMHPFLIDINDLFSLQSLKTPCSRPPQKEFGFYNKDNCKLASAFGHFKPTWHYTHFSSCCQAYRNSTMLQKPPIHCKNELYFFSHVTVNCLWVHYEKLSYFLREKFPILHFKFLSASSEDRKSAKFEIVCL